MTKKIAISTAAAVLVSFALCPAPDPLSALVLGGMGAFLCAIPLLILARLAFVKSASKSVHTLVCVLVCLVAILSVACYVLTVKIKNQHGSINDQASVSNQIRHVASTTRSSSWP
jgi:predicted PurR-regulated permease PerM